MVPNRTSLQKLEVAEIRRCGAIRSAGFLAREHVEPGLARVGDTFGLPQRGVLPVVEFLQYLRHALLETDCRLPSQIALDLGNVRPGTFRLARTLRNEHPLATAQVDPAVYRFRLAGPEVTDPAGHLGPRGHL